MALLDVVVKGITNASKAWTEDDGLVLSTRQRFTTAEVNAGATVLAAVDGFQYQLVDATLIAIGGSASGATSVRISATQSSSTVHLVTALVAALTENTIAKPFSSNVSVLAAGASFVANDVNTAVTVNANGTLATSTAVDVILTYRLVRA